MLISSPETLSFGARAIMPSLTIAGVFGITLIILALLPSFSSIVLMRMPAAIETKTFLFNSSFESTAQISSRTDDK